MDIAFHYFAVKSLALKAGFSDDDAQIIAQYSQMTDDFDYTAYWLCCNVPDYIKNPDYDIVHKNGWVKPVQTGFLTDGILGKTDYLNLVIERFQRYTCTPFHFIYKLRSEINSHEYRVCPANIDDESIVWKMLSNARIEYKKAISEEESQFNGKENYKRKALMKIGLLLHIFADTTAHHMFSGFSAYVNRVELKKVKNNQTGDYETDKYNDSVVRFLALLKTYCPWKFPMIGHMMIAHIPDYTHLEFTMEYTNDKGESIEYTRNNTKEFINCSKKILEYLLSCRGCKMISDDDWDSYSTLLRQCFLTDISGCLDEKAKVQVLKPVWSTIGGSYNYSSEEIKKSFVLKSFDLENDVIEELKEVPEELRPLSSTHASDEFYLFNVCAEEVLIDLYGIKPRSK